MYEGLPLLSGFLFLFCLGGYALYLFFSSNPAREATKKEIKPVVDLLLQKGYCPQKIMEIIGYYY
jgi:hypothetical protein